MYEIDKLSYLRIGVQGENVSTTIEVDMTTWADEYPGMRPNVLFKPWNEENPFLMTSEYDEPILSWVVTSEATQTAGVGYTEIRAVNPDTGLVKKTRIIPTSVELSITPGETNASPPGFETWLNRMLAYKDGAEAASEDAEEAMTAAVAAKNAAVTAQGGAEAAQLAAETAQTAAETAQAAAETAQEAAETAQTAAEAAQSAASSSAVDALTAQHRAQTAQSRAETAATTATSSSSTAVSAKTDAVNAKNAAEDAQEAAEAAQTAAESAQSGAVAAKAAAEAAYNGAVEAKSSAETASSAAVGAKTAAETAQAAAADSATAAASSATDAEAAQEAAEAAQAAAEDAAETAQAIADAFASSDVTRAYVATTGSDTDGDGSKEHPFATVNHAFQNANIKTVIVASGEYAQGVTLSDRDVRIICEHGYAHFTGPNQSAVIRLKNCRFELDHIEASTHSVSGFRITNCNGIFRDCYAHNNYQYGFMMVGSEAELYHCRAMNNTIAGFMLGDANSATGKATLFACRATSNGDYGVIVDYSNGMLHIVGGRYGSNKNSTGNLGAGIALNDSSCQCQIDNARIYSNDRGIYASNSGATAYMTIAGCLLRDNYNGAIYLESNYNVVFMNGIYSQSYEGAQSVECFAGTSCTYEAHAVTSEIDPQEP